MADMTNNVHRGSPLIEQQTNYIMNVLWVLVFLTSGDGGTEAGHLMGLLRLPHLISVLKRFFTSAEGQIPPHIIRLCRMA